MTKVDIARGYFVLALPVGAVGLVGSRWIWRRWLLGQRRFDHYLSRAIVVGAPDDVGYVAAQIRAKSGAAYHVVGVAIEDAERDMLAVGEELRPSSAGRRRQGSRTPARGRHRHRRRPAARRQPIHPRPRLVARRTATELVLASRLTDVAGPRIHVRPVEGLPLMHVELPQYRAVKHVLKRGFDVVVVGRCSAPPRRPGARRRAR